MTSHALPLPLSNNVEFVSQSPTKLVRESCQLVRPNTSSGLPFLPNLDDHNSSSPEAQKQPQHHQQQHQLQQLATMTGTRTQEVFRRMEDDEQSDISSLHCGSIKLNPNYKPELDPFITGRQFVPPIEITVRIKQDVPQWLQPQAKLSLERRNSTPTSPLKRPQVVRRHVSHQPQKEVSGAAYIFNGKPITSSPRRHSRQLSGQTSVGSTTGQSSLHTSPTDSCSSDDGSARLGSVPERSGMVKREIKHMFSKMSLFKKKEQIDLQRSKGCLA